MLPCFLMSDVDVNQQGSFNFDPFPTAMFLTQLHPNSLSNSHSRREPAKHVELSHNTPTKPNSGCMVSSKTNPKLSSHNNSNNVESVSKQLVVSNTYSIQEDKHVERRTTNEKQAKSPNSTNGLPNHIVDSQPASADPCFGLTNYIRRKDKRRFVCVRCGSTHSNCVKAKSSANPREAQLRKQRLNRARSAITSSSKKTISICPNCGKRSHSSATRDIDLYRSMTWPLPLERIMEDEEGCCVDRGCLCAANLTGGKMFQPVFSRKETSCNDKAMRQRRRMVYEKLLKESLPSVTCNEHANNAGINKVLIASICRSALTFIQSMRRWTIEKFGDGDLLHFVAMVTKDNMKSEPDLLRAVDSNVIVDMASLDDVNKEAKVILEAAQSSQVQTVWIDSYNPNKHNTLYQMLDKAGILLQTTSMPNILGTTSLPRANHSSQGDIESLPHHSYPSQNNAHNNKVKDEMYSELNIVALLSTAVHIADRKNRARYDAYLTALTREEILPGESLVETDCIELAHHGTKYRVKVSRISGSCCYVDVAGWSAEVDVNRLSDGLLLSLDGATYHTSLKESLNSFHVEVDKEVYEFGKVRSGASAHESCNGDLLNNLKNSFLHPGSLTEESPSTSGVQSNNGYRRLSEKMKTRNHKPTISNGNTDLPRALDASFQSLSRVMRGWCYPSDVAEGKMEESVGNLLTSLNDPTLPLLQMQDAVAGIGGSLPPPVERGIGKEMSRYASNITSMMILFPGARIKKIIESYGKSLAQKSDRDLFYSSVEAILEVVRRFSSGIRGHMKDVLLSLLREYHRVEAMFQERSFQESVLFMLRSNMDASRVLGDIRSHACVSQKNLLALHLINSLTNHEQNLREDVRSLLVDISALSSGGNAKVALKARQVVRRARKIPYELRYNQLDSIFLSLMCSCDENLSRSISDADTFEILPQFFCHNKPEVRMAALEIYTRRAYTSCQLHSIRHHQVSSSNSAIVVNYEPSSGKDSNSNEPLTSNRFSNSSFESSSDPGDDPPSHLAIITSFSDLDAFERCIPGVLQLFDSTSYTDYHGSNATTLGSFDCGNAREGFKDTNQTSCDEPTRTLHVTMTTTDDVTDDDVISQMLDEFLTQHKTEFDSVNLQRMVFFLHRRKEDAKYFVFKSTGQTFTEERILRHVEPGLSFQFGLNQMQGANLKSLPSQHGLHIYLATSEMKDDDKVVVRTVVRDENAETNVISIDLLRDDMELALLEALDDLNALSTDLEEYRKHVYINIIKNVTSDVERVSVELRSVVLGYVARLWARNVREVQVSARTRSCDENTPFDIRLVLESETECSIH